MIDDLALLNGPRHGRHLLPGHLEATLRQPFDFDDETERRLAYQVVLEEACSPADLTDWLERETLVALWPDLYLPKVVRAAWEARHPLLAQGRAGASGA